METHLSVNADTTGDVYHISDDQADSDSRYAKRKRERAKQQTPRHHSGAKEERFLKFYSKESLEALLRQW
jgi:hypothetical protein